MTGTLPWPRPMRYARLIEATEQIALLVVRGVDDAFLDPGRQHLPFQNRESCAHQPVVMLGVARPLLRQVLEPSDCLVIVERTVSAFDIAVAISRVVKKLTDVQQAVCPFYAPLMVQVVIPLRHRVNDNEISPLGSD